MGSIYRPTYRDKQGTLKHSSIYWITYYANGKAIFENTKTRDHAEARRMLKRKEGDVAEGKPIIKGQASVRFKDLAQDVETDYRINGKRSLRDVEIRLKCHLLPSFGEMKVVTITTVDIRRYIDMRQSEEAANGSINRELALLKRTFNLGIQAGRIPMSCKPHIPMLQEDNVRTGFLERDQFEAVLKHLREELRPMVTFAYGTGWRRGEVLSLRWPQVDFEGRTVRLDPGTTKNGEGRTIYMTDELETLLRNQRQRADKLKRAGTITPFVFFQRGGGQIKEFKRNWTTACRKAGVPGRMFHDLRRTATRNMVRAGIPERVAMMMTGHKTRSVFERYNIVSEGDLKEAARKLNDAFSLRRVSK